MEKKLMAVELLVEVECLDEDDTIDILNDYFSPGSDGPVEIVSVKYNDKD